MRRRQLDELTDREREVLDLLRRDFTNEQIAQRLNISLDGAKYHVSQILSKLGVATREEAAAVALGERRRWWAAWPMWAKIAGAATVAAAVAGLGVLVWAAARNEGSTEQVTRETQSATPPVTQSPSGPAVIDTTFASSLDGWPIVFSAQQGNDFEVYVLDGSNLRNLSNSPGQPDSLPALSPDGTRVTYFTHRSEVVLGTEGDNKPQFVDKRDLNIQNLDGSDRLKLTEAFPSHDNIQPLWSPDSTRIAFESEPEDGNSEIFVINSDGSGLINFTNHAAVEQGPTWSPDGTRIAFTSTRDGRGDIYVGRVDGTPPVRIATGNSPAWSPNGSLIAFWSDRDGNGEIYVVNSDGSGETNLTASPANDFPALPVGHYPPAWSPDGSRIAFLSDRAGGVELYLIQVDEGGITRLTDDPAEEAHPSWSPDGTYVAFISATFRPIHMSSTFPTIRVARADASEKPRPVVNLQPLASSTR